MGSVGERLEEFLHVLPEERVVGDGVFVGPQFAPGGELAVLEQIGDLEKRGVLRELFDGIAPVAEGAGLAVDVAHLRRAFGGIGEPTVERHQAESGPQLGDVEAILVFSALEDGEDQLVVSISQNGFGHSCPFVPTRRRRWRR
jgi:hypothetical protein